MPKAKGPDIEQFEKQAMPHLDSVYRAAVALCGRVHQAEELVQTTYVKALGRFDTFRRGSDCRAWLMQILRNTWIDTLRHNRIVGHTVSADQIDLPQPTRPTETTWSDPNDLLENFADQQIIRALAELPPDQRLALFLADVEQCDHNHIAEITGVAVGTVKSRTSRARAALKTKLADHAKNLGLTGRKR